MIVTRTSMISGITRSRNIDVTEEQIACWQSGEHIQKAMPNLSPSDREFIVTGITDQEWDSVFLDDEDLFDDEPAF